MQSKQGKGTGEFLHNHIEDDWVEGDKPESKFDTQKGWKSSNWTKKHAYLDADNKVADFVMMM